MEIRLYFHNEIKDKKNRKDLMTYLIAAETHPAIVEAIVFNQDLWKRMEIDYKLTNVRPTFSNKISDSSKTMLSTYPNLFLDINSS
jgi:hypothetical protein